VGIFRSLLHATTAAHVISAEGAKPNKIIALKGPPNSTRTSTPALHRKPKHPRCRRPIRAGPVPPSSQIEKTGAN